MDDYGTIHRNDFRDSIKNKNGALIGYVSCIGIVILLSCVSFNIGGLYVGSIHQNASCYENKNMMSLATWLISVNTVAIISGFIVAMAFIFMMCGHDSNSRGIVFVFLGVGLCIGTAVYFFIMVIIGIIELSYQFPSCKNEVGVVCGMVIASIVINLLTMCSTISRSKTES